MMHPSKHTGAPLQSILPAIAGCAMILASLLPWLNDPLGGYYSAWSLPVNMGWPFQVKAFNYGLLCLCCALYTFIIASQNWRAWSSKELSPVWHPTPAGTLCLVPVIFFLWQYLCVDLGTVSHLAQHQLQAVLTQQNFGYNVATPLFPIDPSSWDISTLLGRLQLLVDLGGVGLFVPLFSGFMLLESRRLFAKPARPVHGRTHGGRLLLITGFLLGLAVLLGRGPAAMACEYQAKSFLSAGEYQAALRWLDIARLLNPALDEVSYYHVERGQAWYFLSPDHPNEESNLYLAQTYLQQKDYADAYQQLAFGESAGQRPPWLVEEISLTLEQFAQSFRPLSSLARQAAGNLGTIQPAQGANNGNATGMNDPSGQGALANKTPIANLNAPLLPVQRITNDALALPWLQRLEEVDPTNVYAQYLVGRIQYDLHDYAGCQEQMDKVLQLSPDAAVQSSAYTYIALSDAQQGDYTSARRFLLKAVALDPTYRNNTAREELSGLR
jgi:tetratricopeptide (TPR) repeat protein